MKEKYLYSQITKSLASEIICGAFLPGEKFLSRRELCHRFEIGAITANRIQQELAEQGLIRKVRGSGTYINYVPADSPIFKKVLSAPEKLQQLVVFTLRSNSAISKGYIKGMESKANELGLKIHFEYIMPNVISFGALNAYPVAPNTGYIVISTGASTYFSAGALLLSPMVKTVLIDYIISGSYCIIFDNFDAMRQIVEYALKCKKTKLVFADNFCAQLGALNAGERRIAFENEIRLQKCEGKIVDSGDFNDLLALFKGADAPDAVIFPQDTPALKLKRLLKEKKIKKMPLLTGIDNYSIDEKGLDELTTICFDYEQIGREAVKILYDNFARDKTFITRVKGKLLKR